uniref:AlNc14C4G616 protein n=1 Tax=Albugo laibachii Nc14 TaxID=890382 RepID=F0W0H4_9STRA|nr:AlNc14C4G616 [Albugo laibachii Nc14]|eukprot:CCA14546.1 AlNc14C4G616 [Albugo laibachii Nc14]
MRSILIYQYKAMILPLPLCASPGNSQQQHAKTAYDKLPTQHIWEISVWQDTKTKHYIQSTLCPLQEVVTTENGKRLLTIREKLVEATLNSYCFNSGISYAQDIAPCMKCLAMKTNGFVFLLQKDNDDGTKAFFHAYALGQADNIELWVECTHMCGVNLSNIKTAVCRKLNSLQFDAPPISDEIFGWMSEEEQKKQKNVVIKYSSQCVWALYAPKGYDYNRCHDCITITKKTRHVHKCSENEALSFVSSNSVGSELHL